MRSTTSTDTGDPFPKKTNTFYKDRNFYQQPGFLSFSLMLNESPRLSRKASKQYSLTNLFSISEGENVEGPHYTEEDVAKSEKNTSDENGSIHAVTEETDEMDEESSSQEDCQGGYVDDLGG